uniref:Uncharacterized protein n=1 Tax=Leptobrachium leishanense TaxID=445787 RepID=A0A8C5QSC5_9ANUR
MAVSSLHYTMGISSGFKVYILEGQHSPRDTDTLRPFTSHRIPVYPIKRKRSPEPPHLPKRAPPASTREKVTLSPVNVKPFIHQRTPLTTTPNSPGPALSLEHILKTLIPSRRFLEKGALTHQDEQPLALIKRLEQPTSPVQLQQNRPSVITCVTKSKPTRPPAETVNPLRNGETQDSLTIPDVEEHFQRSLTSCYRRPQALRCHAAHLAPPSSLTAACPAPPFSLAAAHHAPPSSLTAHPAHPSSLVARLAPPSSPATRLAPPSSPATRPAPPSSLSVEDHFSKALGSKWLLIRAAADSPSSPPERTRPL